MGEGLDGGVFDQPAPDVAEAFDEDGGDHDGDGGEGERDNGVVAGGEAGEAFERYLEERGDHYDGEDEDANRFEAAAANRVGVLVAAGDEVGGCPDDGSRKEIEGSVDKGREDREGGGQDDHGDLGTEKDKVGGEVEVDGDGDDAARRVEVLVRGEVHFFEDRMLAEKGCFLVGDFVEVFWRSFDFDGLLWAGPIPVLVVCILVIIWLEIRGRGVGLLLVYCIWDSDTR